MRPTCFYYHTNSNQEIVQNESVNVIESISPNLGELCSMHFQQNPHHHKFPTTQKQPPSAQNKSTSATTASISHQLAPSSDDIIGLSDDNASGLGSGVGVGLVNGDGVGDDDGGLVGVTTWFHAGASGKGSAASVSVSSPQPRGYCQTQMMFHQYFFLVFFVYAMT